MVMGHRRGRYDVSSARRVGRRSGACLDRHSGTGGRKGKGPLAIVEIGGSGSWTFSGDSSFGPTVGVEFDPIKNWLEIEVGTGPMFGNGIREWETDILFKKPFILSDKVEFMVGAGPQ
jgi:hypothetical protein